jgi:hypothetical protein
MDHPYKALPAAEHNRKHILRTTHLRKSHLKKSHQKKFFAKTEQEGAKKATLFFPHLLKFSVRYDTLSKRTTVFLLIGPSDRIVPGNPGTRSLNAVGAVFSTISSVHYKNAPLSQPRERPCECLPSELPEPPIVRQTTSDSIKLTYFTLELFLVRWFCTLLLVMWPLIICMMQQHACHLHTTMSWLNPHKNAQNGIKETSVDYNGSDSSCDDRASRVQSRCSNCHYL